VITSGQVLTRCPQTPTRGWELLPVQVLDQQRLVPCWHRHHVGYQHWQNAVRAQQQLPVAIVLGGHPTSPLTALAVLPPHADPFQFGGLLQGSSTELVKCRTSDLEVPAHAEIVIEGMIDPAATLQPAGRLGLPTGFYSVRSDSLPVIQVTAITHRANPVFPAQVFGPPPSEDGWMRLALERLFLPWVRSVAPEIVDYHAPVSGGGRTWLFVSICKSYPQQAHKVLHALWSHPATMFTKGIVVVDDDVDLHAADDVWFTVGAHVDPERDLVTTAGPVDVDDHAGPLAGVGHKWGIDATRKSPEERSNRIWPRALTMPEAIRQQVTARWAEFGLSHREETAS
jgi:4-hydroxy-3-polyprenylbenzoate decarboxylase